MKKVKTWIDNVSFWAAPKSSQYLETYIPRNVTRNASSLGQINRYLYSDSTFLQ